MGLRLTGLVLTPGAQTLWQALCVRVSVCVGGGVLIGLVGDGSGE